MAAEESILRLMQLNGPVLPADVAKTIRTDIIIAAAHLSEMASRHKVKISKLKVGGSPLYFIPGHEEKLQRFISNLGEKEHRAFELLKQERVLRDSSLEPIIRVAIRDIKDFALPLTVNFNNTQEIFWKWFLTSDEEATTIIRTILNPPKQEVAPEPPAPQPRAPEPIQEQTPPPVQQPAPVQETVPEPAKQSVLQEKPKKAPVKKPTGIFTQDVHQFFTKKNIAIINEEVKRKDKELDYIIDIPSPIGPLRYFCKARNKKRCNDKDLSSALVESQMRKMPIIFLYADSLTTKAEELSQTDMFKTMVLYSLSHGD